MSLNPDNLKWGARNQAARRLAQARPHLVRAAQRGLDHSANRGLDRDEARYEAIDVVESYLLHDEAWADVPATDISDIATEIVDAELRDRLAADIARIHG